jgi:hypothetical protein
MFESLHQAYRREDRAFERSPKRDPQPADKTTSETIVNTCDSAGAAKQLLSAVEAGNLARLAAELEHTPAPPAGLAAADAERWELLDAIAGDLRRTLRRMRLHALKELDGFEVNARLLRHLAGQPLFT